MKLVIDTNVIISAFIRDGVTRKILFHPELHLITSDFTFDEIGKYEDLICLKANISKQELQLLVFLLAEKLFIVPWEEYRQKIDSAMGMIDDPKDTPFLAPALCTTNNGIWSNDKVFTQQNKVRVWSTEELMNYFGL
ncbi:MAG: putative toxin-antitoxin system toxin component, PIN family [Nanoarchaeota archaeon]|nr:putative toxin-antitoxin system toxin component, PIN family [Nanoarchaeota archaeon]|tara:strand:+ start:982 stop:1392 length:411 start_codon:yes stop_codon:yes gene_type:complete